MKNNELYEVVKSLSELDLDKLIRECIYNTNCAKGIILNTNVILEYSETHPDFTFSEGREAHVLRGDIEKSKATIKQNSTLLKLYTLVKEL